MYYSNYSTVEYYIYSPLDITQITQLLKLYNTNMLYISKSMYYSNYSTFEASCTILNNNCRP